MSTITSDTKANLQVHRVRADKRARFNAQIWQAIARAERIHNDTSVAVVEITDETDTIIVASWRNWLSLMERLDSLEKEIATMKGAQS